MVVQRDVVRLRLLPLGALSVLLLGVELALLPRPLVRPLHVLHILSLLKRCVLGHLDHVVEVGHVGHELLHVADVAQGVGDD